jgi:hypothetical protein
VKNTDDVSSEGPASGSWAIRIQEVVMQLPDTKDFKTSFGGIFQVIVPLLIRGFLVLLTLPTLAQNPGQNPGQSYLQLGVIPGQPFHTV